MMGEPENLEVRRGEDGVLRWWMSTREGWQIVGVDGGRELRAKAEHYAEGARLTLVEPLPELE